MTLPLPLALHPHTDETWHSYLTRRAAQHGATTAELADHIGLRRHGQWPAYHGVILSAERTREVASHLGLTPADITALHLITYDQRAFDLSALHGPPGINATRSTVHSAWVHLAGSRYCPTCLSEERIWRLIWRLPWITTCLTHGVRLVATCPVCHSTPGSASTRRASAPHRVDLPADARVCGQPLTDGDTCSTNLSLSDPAPATEAETRRTHQLLTLIESDHGTVAGQPYSSLQVLRAWQATIGLARHLGATEASQWGQTHRWNSPPRDSTIMNQLLATAAPVIEATDITRAGEVIEQWCRNAGIRTPHANTFDRATQPSAALRPILESILQRHGRVHTVLQRQLVDRQGHPLLAPDWTVDDVPQVLWPCALPDRLRNSTKPNTRILRAVAAMILVRMLSGRDWADAGAELGVPPRHARNWTRHAFSRQFGTLKVDLIQCAATIGPLLPKQPHPRAWSSRPVIDGYGVGSLVLAQQPRCRREDPDTLWCPCSG